jgi:hypothetical protein
MPERYEPAQDRTPAKEEELARLVREGVHPEGVKDRMKLAVDKLAGNVPLGVDAKNKTARKVIGAGGELLGVFKFGFLGGVLTLLGGLFVYAGLGSALEWKTLGIGVLVLAIGLWALRAAYTAWRNFRAISRA